MVNKLALSILISIILTAIIVSTVNVGTSLFLNEPEYEEYCNYYKSVYLGTYDNITKETCEAHNGTWEPQNVPCDKGVSCPQGYCDFYRKCQEEYNAAQKPYNQYKFYIFAGLGFLLLLIGLFAIENLIQITGLATGGILVLQGIIMNLQNKMVVFLSLIAILVIFGILAWRVINKHENKLQNRKK
jgi:amino acid transporter